jgi:hypothetical protein
MPYCGKRFLTGRFPRYGVSIWSLWPNIRFLPSIVAEKNATKNEHICSMCIKINSRQTGSRNLMGPKTLPTIWGTYHIVGIVFGPVRFLLPVCLLSWFLYTLNIYAHFSSNFSQPLLMAEIWYLVTSRNLTGPKTIPTIWYTYMMLVTKYQISAMNSYWEKCDEKYLGLTDGDDRDLIFGHKRHIGTPYRGKRFWTHQIPTSCLPT